jgi:hypothetical protein
MNAALRVFLLLAIVIVTDGCGSSPSRMTADIQPLLPAGWSASVSNNVVCICRKSEAYIMGSIARPTKLPNTTTEDYFKKDGTPIKPELTLTFVPLISKVEYKRLKAARAPFAEILRKGAASKMEFTLAQRDYCSNAAPSFYTDRWTVFLNKYDERFVEFYPPEVSSEVEAVMKVLKKEFKEYGP